MRRHPLAQMLTIGVIASVIGVAIALIINWFPTSASSQAHSIDTLYDVLLIVSVPVFVLVMTVAIYSVIRFRARPGDMRDGAPIHGSTRLEIIWVLVPFIIVSILAAYAWIVLDDVEAKKPNALTVKVTGQQFAWHFTYPQYGNVTTDELYLPLDRPVEFDINSKDVLHSFWIPSMRLKQDAVPGITTHFPVTPSQIGRYDVVCAELCGIGHSTMRQYANVVQPTEFDSWVKQQKPAPDADKGSGAEGASASSGQSTIQPAG
jgi:cytochrome c oxidase subunit 2